MKLVFHAINLIHLCWIRYKVYTGSERIINYYFIYTNDMTSLIECLNLNVFKCISNYLIIYNITYYFHHLYVICDLLKFFTV